MTTNKISLDSIVDAPCKFVTVFNDRAEVTRRIEVDLKEGQTELVLPKLSALCEQDSIRISGGKGSATVLEVSVSTQTVQKGANLEGKHAELLKQREELEKKQDECSSELKRIEKEAVWLDGWMKSMKEPKHSEAGATVTGGVGLFSAETLTATDKLMMFYLKRLEGIDQKRDEINKKTTELGTQIQIVNDQIPLSVAHSETTNVVIILLEAAKPTKVSLEVAYLIRGCHWVPSYDCRALSEKNSLEMTYYGTVVNNTGEDWNETDLALSTAKPSVGGQPPMLVTKWIGTVKSASHSRRAIGTMLGGLSSMAPAAKASIGPPMRTELATVTEGSSFTNFNIPRATTVLSDGKPRKLTINILQLQADYSYVVHPHVSTFAYLRAKITNTTKDYPLLPGEMSVFSDNNFIAKSSIPLVSPQEHFSVFLGADEAIKVDAKPAVKFQDTQGLFRKSNTMAVKLKSIITNNKKSPVTITVKEQLPKSTDSSVKITLTAPDLTTPQEGVELTDQSILKWKKVLNNGESFTIPFEYRVDWPGGVDITH